MESKKQGKIDWIQLLIGVLYIIAAIYSFRNPQVSLVAISSMVGVLAILAAISEMSIRSRISKYNGAGSGLGIFSAILQFIVGIIFIFKPEVAMASLPFIFAFWIIVTSIIGLIGIWMIRSVFDGALGFLLVLNILGLILGILIISNPLTTVFTIITLVGIYLLIRGIRYIVYAF